MTKYKNIKTGEEVVIEDNYTNCNEVIPVIKSLYDNSSEWIKTFPIDNDNIHEIARNLMEEYCQGLGTYWTEEYKEEIVKGIELQLRSTHNLKIFSNGK